MVLTSQYDSVNTAATNPSVSFSGESSSRLFTIPTALYVYQSATRVASTPGLCLRLIAMDASSRAGSDSARSTQLASPDNLAFSAPAGKTRGWYSWSTRGCQFSRRENLKDRIIGAPAA